MKTDFKMIKYKILLIFTILFLNYNNCYSENTIITNFKEAKNILYKIYNDLSIDHTFYCHCKFYNRKITLNITNDNRGYRTEIEHIVPISYYGKYFKEYYQGHHQCDKKGRSCAEKTNKKFRLILSDIYNLQVINGGLNKLRSNKNISEIQGELRNFGNCDFELNYKQFEPPQNRKGDIARTYMYMEYIYKYNIINYNIKSLILEWDKIDPVDQYECSICKEKEKYQKNENIFVKYECKKLGLW